MTMALTRVENVDLTKAVSVHPASLSSLALATLPRKKNVIIRLTHTLLGINSDEWIIAYAVRTNYPLAFTLVHAKGYLHQLGDYADIVFERDDELNLDRLDKHPVHIAVDIMLAPRSVENDREWPWKQQSKTVVRLEITDFHQKLLFESSLPEMSIIRHPQESTADEQVEHRLTAGCNQMSVTQHAGTKVSPIIDMDQSSSKSKNYRLILMCLLLGVIIGFWFAQLLAPKPKICPVCAECPKPTPIVDAVKPKEYTLFDWLWWLMF